MTKNIIKKTSTREERRKIIDTFGHNRDNNLKQRNVIPLEQPLVARENEAILPVPARIKYGCVSCEWKGSTLCPIPTEEKDGKRNNHKNGICIDRTNYLINFYDGDKKMPKMAEFETALRKGIASLQSMKDYAQLGKMEKAIAEIELNQPDDHSGWNRWERRRQTARKEWFELHKTMMDLDDKRVTRETPKQVEITEKKKLDMEDIHEIMRTKVIEVIPNEDEEGNTEDSKSDN